MNEYNDVVKVFIPSNHHISITCLQKTSSLKIDPLRVKNGVACEHISTVQRM